MTNSERYTIQIEQLKERLRLMLIQRGKERDAGDKANPSQIWHEAVGVFNYLHELSPESLRNIRFHTGLINGVSWEYWHPYPKVNPVAEAERLGYARMLNGVPERYWVSEPPTPNIPRPIGVEYKGKIVNSNVTRFQNCVSILYHAGAMDFIEHAQERQVVVEIGAGYGGLTHCLKAGFDENASCVIVDLPEMLLFSGVFLLVNNPDKSVWVYDQTEAVGFGLVDKILSSDFVLMPNYEMHRLQELKEIALIINLQSFQEMTEEQVSQYLDVARNKLSFCLYSDNLDCHPYNEDLSSISKLLTERFEIFPSQQEYAKLYSGLDPKSHHCYRKYVCQRRDVRRKALRAPDHLFRPTGTSLMKFKRRLYPVTHFVRKFFFEG